MTAPVRVPDSEQARAELLELAQKHGGQPAGAEPALAWCWWFPSCAACRRFVGELEEAGLDVWGSADLAGLGPLSFPVHGDTP